MKEIAEEIKNSIPDNNVIYKPYPRQAIAGCWLKSIDGTVAANDWLWKTAYFLKEKKEDIVGNM